MPGADEARTLTAYNQWANEKILETSARLLDEQLDRQFGASYESIRGNLAHILIAQIVWVARWTGERLGGEFPTSREELWTAFEISHLELARFVDSLRDADWERAIEYQDSNGVDRSLPLGALIIHLVNHGTYHRGEIAVMLTTMGNPPGDLDYLYWVLGTA